MKLWWYQ